MRPSPARDFSAAVLGTLLALGSGACSRPPADRELSFPDAPVILISVDTLRADRLPAYGYGGVDTPAIDRLRRDAVLFENAYSSCPLTLPSHASLLTGLQPYAHAVRDNLGFRLDPAHPTIPAFLGQRGYATAAAVSSYVLRRRSGLGAAFDAYDDWVEYGSLQIMGGLQRRGEETVAAAREWIAGHRDAPFFYFLHLFEPHTPYDPPEPYRSRYPSAYDGEIATADAAVGTFLDDLRRDGVYDRALIVFLSDHGEGLGDHGEREHGILLYREAIRVPLIVKLPGGALAGSSVAAPAQLVDVFPTVADLLGLLPPSALPGRSLFDLDAAAGRTIYSESFYARFHLGWSELRSLVDERYHYIEAPGAPGGRELFDLARDPVQENDLAAAERRVLQRMREAMEGHGEAFQAPAAVDAEEMARLRALGYLAAPAPKQAGPLLHPRDALPALEEMERASALAAEERFAEAAALLEGLVERFPAMLDAQVQLAACLRALGRPEAALERYRSALELQPENAGAVLIAAAETLLDLGRLQQVDEHARAVLDTHPAEGRQLLARAALARGDLEEAARQARRAVEAEPNPRPDAVVLEADILVTRERYEEALAALDPLRRRVSAGHLPPVRSLEYLRGESLARLGREAEAEEAFGAEIRSFPQSSRAYSSLAFLYASMRRFERIEPLLEAMVRASPRPRTYLLAAVTAERLGDVAGGRAWRRRAALAAGGTE